MTVDSLRSQLQNLLQSDPVDYRAVLTLSRELSREDPHFQRFFIDAKTLIHLGRDSIKDHATALIELVKNSYDADATKVVVEVLCRNGNDIIRVTDNGFGMTRHEILHNWLRIGFSNKRTSKLSKLGRRRTGEKGIGRISTDRLGARLELRTKTESDRLIGLRVNWDEFDVDGKDIQDIDVEIVSPPEIDIPSPSQKNSHHGTEIRISHLRQTWTPANIENLYYELSALTPPFREVGDFEVFLNTDVSQEFSKKVDSDFFKAAEIELEAIYDGLGTDLLYSIRDKFSKEEVTERINWKQLLTDLPKRDLPTDLGERLTVGPVRVKLLFFLREAQSIVGTDLRLSDLRAFLDNNAGIKIYRDNFAVRPYGFPHAQLGYDWLQLGDRKSRNPAGIGRGPGEYMVNPNQIVGAVFIARDDNPRLTDSAAREGLVENEAFDELVALVKGAILMLESHRVKIFKQEETERHKKAISSQKEAQKISEELNLVKVSLSSIREDIKQQGDKLKPVQIVQPLERTINRVDDISKDFGTTIFELLNWQRVLSGLATVGISSAVFGHETEGSISQFKSSATTAKLVLSESPPKIQKAITELEKALKHSRLVAAWGAYALTRVQREKRRKLLIPILGTVDNVVSELRPAFFASSIEIKVEGDKLFSRTFQMDIESIAVNLLTNAYTACLLKSGRRQVTVRVQSEERSQKKGFLIIVSDSGPGIAKEFAHRIFEPLFSTKARAAGKSKSVGTGLGLTIVKSVVDDLQGEVTFGKDPELRGARFKVWLPKED